MSANRLIFKEPGMKPHRIALLAASLVLLVGLAGCASPQFTCTCNTNTASTADVGISGDVTRADRDSFTRWCLDMCTKYRHNRGE